MALPHSAYNGSLQQNPLYLIKRNLVIRPVVELGGARALMCGHHLCLFERPIIEEVRRNTRGTECMAPDRGEDAGGGSSALYHA